jgi:hypothetical protein
MATKYTSTAHKQKDINLQRELERKSKDSNDVEILKNAIEGISGRIKDIEDELNNGLTVQHNNKSVPSFPKHKVEVINIEDTNDIDFTVTGNKANENYVIDDEATKVTIKANIIYDEICKLFERIKGLISLNSATRFLGEETQTETQTETQSELIYGFYQQYTVNENNDSIISDAINWALDYDMLTPMAQWETRYIYQDLDSAGTPVLWRGLRFHTDLWNDAGNSGFAAAQGGEATEFHCIKEGLYNIRIKLRGITDSHGGAGDGLHDPTDTLLMLGYGVNDSLVDVMSTGHFDERNAGYFAMSPYWWIDMTGSNIFYLNEGDKVTFGIKAYNTNTTYPGAYVEDTDLIFYIDDFKRHFQLTVEAYRIGGKEDVSITPPYITFEQ